MDQGLEGRVLGLELVDVLLVDALAAVVGARVVDAFGVVDGGAGGAGGGVAVALDNGQRLALGVGWRRAFDLRRRQAMQAVLTQRRLTWSSCASFRLFLARAFAGPAFACEGCWPSDWATLRPESIGAHCALARAWLRRGWAPSAGAAVVRQWGFSQVQGLLRDACSGETQGAIPGP